MSLPHSLPQNLLALASLTYVFCFLVTIPMWWVMLLHKHVISSNPFFSAVNSVFVQQYGYVWFTLAYMGHCFNFADQNNQVPLHIALGQFLRYLLNTGAWIIVNFWCFGPLVVERLNRATGGHCEQSSILVDVGMRKCKENPQYVWEDGFDLLGHYYFIVTLSLWILYNRASIPLAVSRENMGHVARLVLSFVRMLSAWLLTVWFLEFCVTSVFFHTIGERLAGLVSIPVVYGLLGIDKRMFSGGIE